MLNFSPGGIWLDSQKSKTISRPVEQLPPSLRLAFPVAQRPGACAVPCVKKGQRVHIGQPLAVEGDVHSCPVHSSVSGRVTDVVELRHPATGVSAAVLVENDGKDTLYATAERGETNGLDALSPQEIIARIRAAGVLSQPRPALPLWERLEAMAVAQPEVLVLNAVETEPFLCRSEKLLDENPDDIAQGLKLLLRACGAKRVIVAVCDEKQDASDVVRACLLLEVPASMCMLSRRYPAGNEHILRRTLLRSEKRRVNYGFVYAQECLHAFDAALGLPQTRQVITVSGDASERPQNLLVRVGTPLNALLEHCGLRYEPERVVLGSSLRGLTVQSVDIPILKSDTEVLALKESPAPGSHVCVSCGACVNACPQALLPNYLARYALKADFNACRSLRIGQCLECGACAYVCPGRVPILELIKNLKRAGA